MKRPKKILPLDEGKYKYCYLVKEKYIAATKVGCTACAYCMPCPSGDMLNLVRRLKGDKFSQIVHFLVAKYL